MRILVVDNSTESQSLLAGRIESLDPADLESLDITIRLAGEHTYLDRLIETDVLILGPQLGDAAQSMARHAKDANPNLQVILFVTDDNNKLHFPVEDAELPERPGSIVTALIPKAG